MTFVPIICHNWVARYFNEFHFYILELGYNCYGSSVLCGNGIYDSIVPAANLSNFPLFSDNVTSPKPNSAEPKALDSNLCSSWSTAFSVCRPLWHQNSTNLSGVLFLRAKPLLSDRRIGVWHSDPWGVVGGLLRKACIFGPDNDMNKIICNMIIWRLKGWIHK